MTSPSTSGSRLPHAAASMAAKNKHRKKSKATRKVTFQPEDNDMEAENGSGEGDEDGAAVGGEDRMEKEEEFNLEEVLRLGGTQVSLADTTSLQAQLQLINVEVFEV